MGCYTTAPDVRVTLTQRKDIGMLVQTKILSWGCFRKVSEQMRVRKLPDIHCLNCFKVVEESTLKGYLRYFCDSCLKIGDENDRNTELSRLHV